MAFPGMGAGSGQSLYGFSSLGISLEALSALDGPVIQLTQQLTCLEDAAVPADNSFVCHVMDGFVAQASPLSARLWPCFSDSYLCPGYPLPAAKVSSRRCCAFSLGASPGSGVGGRTTGILLRLSEAKLCCLPGPVWHSALIGRREGRYKGFFSLVKQWVV